MEYTILVDMDNTIADFNEAAIRWFEYAKDVDLSDRRVSLDEYDFFANIFTYMGIDYSKRIIEEMFNWPGFWMSMKPMQFSQEILRTLNRYHKLYIVTKPWNTSDNCIPEKIKWIKYHLPFFDLDNLIFTSHKELITGDFIIEDSPKYLANTICKKTIAYNYKYNKNVKSDYRVNNWTDIKGIFKENFLD